MAGEAKRTVEPKGELSRSPKFHERSAERSTRFQRLVSERVPTILLSDEAGEKRRIYDAVVNIQINKSEDNAPEAISTSALSFSTSLPSFIHPTPTASAPPPSDEPSPPVEVVTRRRILNVVNKKSSASELPHSPYLGNRRVNYHTHLISGLLEDSPNLQGMKENSSQELLHIFGSVLADAPLLVTNPFVVLQRSHLIR